METAAFLDCPRPSTFCFINILDDFVFDLC